MVMKMVGIIQMSFLIQERVKKIGVTGKERINNLSHNNHSYLERHRMLINENL